MPPLRLPAFGLNGVFGRNGRIGANVLWIGLASLTVSPVLPLAQDSSQQEQHFTVEKPADLSPNEAAAVYARIIDDMADAFAMSEDQSAVNYRRWQQFNSAPYPSATHGRRYVNNYGNALARSYGAGEVTEAMPVGAVLA